MARSLLRSRTASDGQTLERVSMETRWLAFAAYLVTFPFHTSWSWSVVLLVVLVFTYNATRYLLRYRSNFLLQSAVVMLAVDYGFLAWVLFTSGGIYSPYKIFLATPLLTAAYIRRSSGALPLLVLTILSLVLIWLAAVLPFIEPVKFDGIRIALIYTFTLIIMADFADRLTQSQRQARNYAIVVQHQAEEERNRLATLVNSLADAVLAFNTHGRITLYNAAALDLFGAHSLHGKHLQSILFLHDEKGKTIDPLELVRNSRGALQRSDLSFTDDEGTIRNLDISVAPVLTAYGKKMRSNAYIMLVRDITKTKDLEQRRDEFLSVMTHELRTPVATAEAGLSILLTPKMVNLSPEAIKYAQIAHNNIVVLGEIINDLSSLSRLQAGAYTIKPEPLDIEAVFRWLAKEHNMAARSKGLKLNFDLPDEDLPVTMTGTYEVKEILRNLVSNAIKYTNVGSVTVTVEIATKPENGLLFSVLDTGMGISNTDKPHLFEKFYRSEDYRTQETGGTGLGLYITRKLAERLGATVDYSSKLNKGSTFTLFIPLARKRSQATVKKTS